MTIGVAPDPAASCKLTI